MIGKPDLPDPAGCFLLQDPFLDPKRLQVLPLSQIGKHMHQIVIDMICPQPCQFRIECLIDLLQGFHDILGQLCRDLYFVAAMVFFQYSPETLFIPRIEISRIKIINARIDRAEHFALCFFVIDTGAFFRKTHTAVSEL